MIEKKSQSKISFNFWFAVSLAVITSGALLFGLIILFQANLSLNKKIAEAKEAERPADIDIVILQESSCRDCASLNSLINAIKKENVKVNSEKTVEIASPEGKELIGKYSIAKAPALIVSGEIEKDANLKAIWPQLGEIKDGVFILRQVGAPYVLINSGEVRGRIKFVMLTDAGCGECYKVAQHEQILKQLGLPTQDQQIIDRQSAAGQKLITEYKIKLLPTIILTGDLEVYPPLIKVWPQVGTVEKDGAYVFREGVKQMGVYKDLTANQVIKPAAD
ncbi:MAG: hypothetical protein A3J65_00340 [Candidatus Buchananbacteria bacterium RIFCSPHIGHO2_02_FULL_45_11b]|uniref:Thioredoxin-like fold domain-containing protein n=3 Tax=Candidatus Buchananiibacteriota TaxID=1817903 RepID=A0A1G1YEZ8_9BACT|nr:MAG: hypothetical protein A3J65_00340 [Candidatus Buchananbacteria bacterium RIFCSPHIGHO2_02_FULL_45_11b]OGY53594.1 MAG: hypothetical protein A3B15_03410 [Candidatus Buchananbacteria bacterium RIFCSPLOWO2_01_FULL_45_31]OGY57349.1 MAG: hypothetical protein A3H67_04390 [Candidatus Buchananbacteria bacterium RIFCSPLOWO2_02_FULL_46_11b]